MNKKKVAIIGANGFLGLSICNALINNGYRVYGFIRNENSAYHKLYKKLNINTKLVGNLEEIKNLNLDKSRFDFIINLAARAHIRGNLFKNVKLDIKKLNNIEKNIVNNFDVKNTKIIHLSSAKVKLNLENSMISDNELAYIDAKLKSEKIIRSHFNHFVILRPPLIYGPYVKANFLSLIKAVDNRLPLPFLNLKNSRSYLYVENLIDIILKILQENQFSNKFYYVSDGNPVSTKYLCDLIGGNLCKSPRYFNLNKNLIYFMAKFLKKQNTIDKIYGDFIINNTTVEKDLGWFPKHNLKFGIKNTCFWYKTMFKMKN